MSSQLSRTGEWFLHSGIQQPDGGVARYYLTDSRRPLPASTEITGYAVSALVYLHTVTHDERYLHRAVSGANFLVRAWDNVSEAMPFEIEPSTFTYFFDCGIIVRGLLAVWRATGGEAYLLAAKALGQSMVRDFASAEGEFHPILALPSKSPLDRDPLRWSRTATCYQLKSAMAWDDLYQATGDPAFLEPYERVLEASLRTYAEFLPGHPDRPKVMDRLHAFCYFLEGLLPRAARPECAAALRDGISRAACHLREIGPEFARSDVYAQLLRVRLYADWLGAVPLDLASAQHEAVQLASFQHRGGTPPDPQLDGGYWFGRKGGETLPYMNPVSAAFACQALQLWETRDGGAQAHRHLLI
ncbi:MAG: hypothetical protein ABI806_04880 [Candidatus Solibacter sp.]